MDLNESIRRLDKVFLHSKYIGNYIHHCTVNFYENLVHRVNAEFNKKIAKVSKVIGSVTEDATRINRIIYEANYLVSNKRHIDLFDNYDRLLKQAEYMYFKKHEGKPGLTLRPDPGQGGIRGPSGQPSDDKAEPSAVHRDEEAHHIPEQPALPAVPPSAGGAAAGADRDLAGDPEEHGERAVVGLAADLAT